MKRQGLSSSSNSQQIFSPGFTNHSIQGRHKSILPLAGEKIGQIEDIGKSMPKLQLIIQNPVPVVVLSAPPRQRLILYWAKESFADGEQTALLYFISAVGEISLHALDCR